MHHCLKALVLHAAVDAIGVSDQDQLIFCLHNPQRTGSWLRLQGLCLRSTAAVVLADQTY